MPIVELAGTGLHYERAGNGEPLLLIQGMSANRLAWGEPFPALLRESFDCIAFDNRGMGLSRPVAEPFTIADMAADAAGLLDALEIERVHVFGISMGGMIAQELALAHPGRMRSLALGCTYCGGPDSQLMSPADFQGVAEAMAAGDPQRFYREMWEINFSAGHRAEEDRYAPFLAMAETHPVRRRTFELQLRAIAAHDTSARLGTVSAPTLVVHGTADRVLPVVDSEVIAGLIPDARLELLEDVGHLFWWEQPQRCASLLRDHCLAAAA